MTITRRGGGREGERGEGEREGEGGRGKERGRERGEREGGREGEGEREEERRRKGVRGCNIRECPFIQLIVCPAGQGPHGCPTGRVVILTPISLSYRTGPTQLT